MEERNGVFIKPAEEERRATRNALDIAGGLAIMYTFGFLVMAILLYYVSIPPANKEPLLQLFGLMSAIQMAVIAAYFGQTKSAEATQRAIEQRQGRSEAVVQEIAKAAAPAVVAAPAVAAPPVTPAQMNPATGVVPAAEVLKP